MASSQRRLGGLILQQSHGENGTIVLSTAGEGVQCKISVEPVDNNPVGRDMIGSGYQDLAARCR